MKGVEFLNLALQIELQKAFPYLQSRGWIRQNNSCDYKSNFIYNTYTFNELVEHAQANDVDFSYICHRWYNFHTSIECENIFINNGCIKESDTKNKEIDLYINDIPYDIKLSVYPAKYISNESIESRTGKNDLIRWLYLNQSQQGRKHLANRLFIICKANTPVNNPVENLMLKCRFDLIEPKIEQFLRYYQTRELNSLTIQDNEAYYQVFSDVIYISN